MLCKGASSKTNSLYVLWKAVVVVVVARRRKAKPKHIRLRIKLKCTDDDEDQIKQEIIEEAVGHKTRVSKAESWR